jgi:hypothetical protein
VNFCIEYSQVVLAEITHWNERFTTTWNTERGGSAGPSYAADGGTYSPVPAVNPKTRTLLSFYGERWLDGSLCASAWTHLDRMSRPQ